MLGETRNLNACVHAKNFVGESLLCCILGGFDASHAFLGNLLWSFHVYLRHGREILYQK